MCQKMYCKLSSSEVRVWFKCKTLNSSNVLQAEDLVANFFPKKLLELDQFLKVSFMFSL